MDEENKKKKSKAEEIAEIMGANMIANMKDPKFLEEKERILQEVADKVIAERRKRESENEIYDEDDKS